MVFYWKRELAGESTGQDLPTNKTYPAERLIKGMVNTGILRSRFTDQLNFHSWIQQVCERVLNVYTHSGLPSEQIMSALVPEQGLNHGPLWECS
jgi:hypothetical protein